MNNCTHGAQRKFPDIWILACANHSRIVAPQQEWNKIYPSGRQLWDKIQEKREHNAPHTFIPRKYEITQDWTGSLYNGITLNWDYKAGILDMSMPGYIKNRSTSFSTLLQADLITPHTNGTPLDMAPQHHN